MKVGYVCTNFNTAELTVAATETFLANREQECHVVVVDNHSEPADVEVLSKLGSDHENVSVLLGDQNLGYFPGLNRGIGHLRSISKDWQWIVIGNNDLEFPGDFMEKLNQNASRLSEHAVVSPDIVTADGEHQNPHVISHISSIRELFYDLYYSNFVVGSLIQALAMKLRFLSDRRDEEQWRVGQFIYQGHGACYLLGARFFERYEQLWAPTVLLGEEFFLSKQLSDIGHRVYYDPGIRVLHKCHASLDKLPSRTRWNYAREAHRVYRQHVKLF